MFPASPIVVWHLVEKKHQNYGTSWQERQRTHTGRARGRHLQRLTATHETCGQATLGSCVGVAFRFGGKGDTVRVGKKSTTEGVDTLTP